MTDCPDDMRRRLQGAGVLPPLDGHTASPECPSGNSQRDNRRQTRHTPKRKTDRWTDFNAFIDVTMASLNPRQIRVWLCLFRDAGKDGVCRTAQSYIAKRTGLRRPTVSSTIAELEALGLVVTEHAGGLNRGLSEYRIRPVVGR
jgi:hypothetical protein